jgi:hypothetical protein
MPWCENSTSCPVLLGSCVVHLYGAVNQIQIPFWCFQAPLNYLHIGNYFIHNISPAYKYMYVYTYVQYTVVL